MAAPNISASNPTRQREESEDEVLIFVIDESYDRIGEYVNWDDYSDEHSATEAASNVFRNQIRNEFETEFDEANIGPGADVPVFVTAITSNLIPLMPWLFAVFFSGKPIIDNISAWRTIYEKIQPYFGRIVILNRNGAAVLAIEAVFEEMDGLPKSITLHGYRSKYRHDNDGASEESQCIDEAPPTLNLSMLNHAFKIEADGVLFSVAVDGSNVTLKRLG